MINIDLMICDYDFSSDDLKELKKFVEIEKNLVWIPTTLVKRWLGLMESCLQMWISFCKELCDLTQKYHS